jgi:hypothetical protein
MEPRSSSLVIANYWVIPAQCEKVMVRLESPLGVENGLLERSPEANLPEELYIAKTLVRDRREVPVRVLNATRRDQRHTKKSPWHTVSHACDHNRCLTTTGPRHYPEVTGRDCSGQAKHE